MVYKTVSTEAIIAKVYRDFKPSNSGWLSDAIEWVGEAVETIGCFTGYKQISKKFDVIDYRVKLPCEIEQLLGVEYCNTRLQRSGGINSKADCTCLDNLVCHPEESYSMNPNYIHTTFKEGEVTLHYYAIDVDCNGFPTIVDNPKVKEAVSWRIMRGMLLRGHKHQTIDFPTADRMWEKFYPQAQNACKLADPDDYELFKKSWLGLARTTNLTNEMFNTVVSTNPLLASPNAPGVLVPNLLTIQRDSE